MQLLESTLQAMSSLYSVHSTKTALTNQATLCGLAGLCGDPLLSRDNLDRLYFNVTPSMSHSSHTCTQSSLKYIARLPVWLSNGRRELQVQEAILARPLEYG